MEGAKKELTADRTHPILVPKKISERDWNGVEPESSGASLRGHKDGLGDVIQDLEQKLSVGARLGGGLDLVGVQLARLPRFDDSAQKEAMYCGREFFE